MADRDSRSGERYSSAELFDYVARVHAAHDESLEAAFVAPEAHEIPAIQVGPSEGKLLELLMRLIGAEKVVEVGTLVGYSAIRLARGLSDGGRLWTIESSAEHAEVARQRIAAAGFEDRVELRLGAALDVLPELEEHGPFDAVFVDADKQNYHHYGRWAASNLRAGGLLIGDNAFLFGNLMEETERGQAMRRFHEEAAAAFDSVCIPTPDGLLLGAKR